MAMVSVVIPVYNAANYLRACLDSVLVQTLRDMEVICVDDGSTDGSPKVLAEYAARDARIRVLTQENAGQGAARNRGLSLATGRYVYFMDADDRLADNQALASLAETVSEENLDALFFDARVEYAEERLRFVIPPGEYSRKREWNRTYEGPALLRKMFFRQAYCVSPCLVLWRRDFLAANALAFPEGVFYEDTVFMLRAMLSAQRVSHRRRALYVRLAHAGSTMTRKPTTRHLRGRVACYRAALECASRADLDLRTRCVVRLMVLRHKWQIRRTAEGLPPLDDPFYRRAMKCSPVEKIWNGLVCLHDRGLAYTLRRIIAGRRIS